MYKRLATALVVTGSLLVATATSALAGTPTGGYAQFANCPYTNLEVVGCIYAKTETGEFVVGKKTVPVTKTITLQGGVKEENAAHEQEFVAATNGETLSKTPENVPGGLAGLVNCQEITGSGLLEGVLRSACESVFEEGLTGVTATTEIAGSPSMIRLDTANLLGGSGIALKLPVKVHLENTLLGSECYIGSDARPLDLELTTGTTSPPEPNQPIKGNPGTIVLTEHGTIATISNNTLVNNSFAAPEVTGCGGLFSFLLDPIVDSQLGVPSESGHNTAILSGTLSSGDAIAIEESANS